MERMTFSVKFQSCCESGAVLVCSDAAVAEGVIGTSPMACSWKFIEDSVLIAQTQIVGHICKEDFGGRTLDQAEFLSGGYIITPSVGVNNIIFCLGALCGGTAQRPHLFCNSFSSADLDRETGSISVTDGFNEGSSFIP